MLLNRQPQASLIALLWVLAAALAPRSALAMDYPLTDADIHQATSQLPAGGSISIFIPAGTTADVAREQVAKSPWGEWLVLPQNATPVKAQIVVQTPYLQIREHALLYRKEDKPLEPPATLRAMAKDLRLRYVVTLDNATAYEDFVCIVSQPSTAYREVAVPTGVLAHQIVSEESGNVNGGVWRQDGACSVPIDGSLDPRKPLTITIASVRNVRYHLKPGLTQPLTFVANLGTMR